MAKEALVEKERADSAVEEKLKVREKDFVASASHVGTSDTPRQSACTRRARHTAWAIGRAQTRNGGTGTLLGAVIAAVPMPRVMADSLTR